MTSVELILRWTGLNSSHVIKPVRFLQSNVFLYNIIVQTDKYIKLFNNYLMYTHTGLQAPLNEIEHSTF